MNRHLRLFCVYESKHQTLAAESVVSIGLIYMDKTIIFRFFSFISIIAFGSSNAFSESLADQMLGTWDFAIDNGYHVTFFKNGTVYAKGTYSDYEGFWTVDGNKVILTEPPRHYFPDLFEYVSTVKISNNIMYGDNKLIAARKAPEDFLKTDSHRNILRGQWIITENQCDYYPDENSKSYLTIYDDLSFVCIEYGGQYNGVCRGKVDVSDDQIYFFEYSGKLPLGFYSIDILGTDKFTFINDDNERVTAERSKIDLAFYSNYVIINKEESIELKCNTSSQIVDYKWLVSEESGTSLYLEPSGDKCRVGIWNWESEGGGEIILFCKDVNGNSYATSCEYWIEAGEPEYYLVGGMTGWFLNDKSFGLTNVKSHWYDYPEYSYSINIPVSEDTFFKVFRSGTESWDYVIGANSSDYDKLSGEIVMDGVSEAWLLKKPEAGFDGYKLEFDFNDKKFKFTQIKTTGINPIRVNNIFSDKIYDISGKEIKSLKPGINIKKGLKIFVP